MRKLKIMTVVGTRPEIIKLSRVIAELNEHMDHVLVHTGQNFDYELNEIFFNELKIKSPDYSLNAAGKNAAITIGKIIIKMDSVLKKEKPDAVLVYGDTNSSLSVVAAKKRKIPIFHIEAGNRCYDQRVPEEVNRKVVDHISDINMTLSEHARQHLLREGIAPQTIFKMGSAMQEVFNYYQHDIQSCDILDQLSLVPHDYIIVSVHREENLSTNEKVRDFLHLLNHVAHVYQKKVIVSTHPRTKAKLHDIMKRRDAIKQHADIVFMKPFGFIAYSKLQQSAFCVLSDSGSITEDANILNFPAIMLRERHERPEGMDSGTAVVCRINSKNMNQAISLARAHYEKQGRLLEKIPDYDVDHFSKKVVRIILSYVDDVNHQTWCKKI